MADPVPNSGVFDIQKAQSPASAALVQIGRNTLPTQQASVSSTAIEAFEQLFAGNSNPTTNQGSFITSWVGDEKRRSTALADSAPGPRKLLDLQRIMTSFGTNMAVISKFLGQVTSALNRLTSMQ